MPQPSANYQSDLVSYRFLGLGQIFELGAATCRRRPAGGPELLASEVVSEIPVSFWWRSPCSLVLVRHIDSVGDTVVGIVSGDDRACLPSPPTSGARSVCS